MNTINKFFFFFLMISGLAITGCVDNDFDEPENTFMVDQNDVVTIESITEVLDTTFSFLLTDDFLGGENKYLKAAVTADDASGNLFKIVVFDDETGALSIIPDRNELNAEFPTGTVIYVKLNGLTISKESGTPQLGYGLDEDDQLQRIPDLLVNDFLFASAEKKTIAPEIITIGDYIDNENMYYNKLVTFQGVEFTSEYAGSPYAISNAGTADEPETINAIINDCDANSIIVRNSGYSNFVDNIIPLSNGSVTGILSKFGSDLQLFLRSEADVNLSDPRCLDALGEESIMTVEELVNLSSDNFLFLDKNSTGKDQAYIRATVIADDESGTFYKTLIVQDETAGIRLSLDAFDLYKTYPVGSEILVSLNGLTLQSDAGTPTIGDGKSDEDRLERIPETKVGSVVISTPNLNQIEPLVVTIEDIKSGGEVMLNRLVKLNRVEFPQGEVGNGFAAEENRNIDLSDCSSDVIILRSSSFSDFAENLIPNGSGEFVAITGKFLDDFQVYQRSLDDLNFNQERCDGSGGTVDNEITIGSIKERYYSLGADKSEEGFITGTVISNKDNSTFQEKNIVLQNGSDGIVVRFTGAHNYSVGTKLKINVTEQELSEFNDLLQINNVPNFNAESQGTTSLPTPTELTIDELLLDINKYESTLVKILQAEFVGGSTYGDSPDIDDGTESIQLFTKFSSSFANESLPSGKVDVTAILSQFTNPQLIINSTSDVSGGNIDPGGDPDLDEGFVGEFRESIAIDGWMNIATKGTRTWYYSNFGDENFAECEGYQDPEPETEAWLITPTLDTDDKSMFSFETQKAFWQHQGLSVWISQDFSDFENANWVSLDQAVIADDSVENFEWVQSGTIDLKDYFSGKVRVAFKYEGTAAQNTTKMRVDNVQLK